MNLNGSITLNIESEDDIIFAAKLIQQRGRIAQPLLAAKQVIEKKPSNGQGKHPTKFTDAEVMNVLRDAFPNGHFTRAKANELTKRVAGISSSKTGRILSKAIDQGKLRRAKAGVYTFGGCKEHVPSQGDALQNKKKRSLADRRRSMLKTLENPLLYFSFTRKLNELNPEGLDEQLIDRNLEPEEALTDLKRHYPNLITYKEDNRDYVQEFKDYLTSIGIENPNIKDLCVSRMESDPFSEPELKAFTKALHLSMQEEQPISVSVKS